jgi:uncharacterized membrane protein YgdD (TMEM256/DUF423 family)
LFCPGRYIIFPGRNVPDKDEIMSKTILMAGAVFLALAVLTGAFGAHALKDRLAAGMMQVYKTGVEYHFYHALGLLLVGVLSVQYPSSWINWSAGCLVAGIVLFSGSLYAMALTGIRVLGAVTPLGGLSFVAGWILLFVAILKSVK